MERIEERRKRRAAPAPKAVHEDAVREPAA
jgi:hypothetical protein